MKRQLCCVLTIPWHCCICLCFWIGKWTPTMEKGHPRYLTAVIKMPPETTSVGRCLWHGLYFNNLVPRSHSVFRWYVVRDWAQHTWLVDYFCIQVAEKEKQISLTQSLGAIIPGGQWVSGHLVEAKKWGVCPPVRPGDITVVNWPWKRRTWTRHKLSPQKSVCSVNKIGKSTWNKCPPRIPLIHEPPSCHDDIHAYAWVLAKVGVVRLSLFKHSREDPFRPINSWFL